MTWDSVIMNNEPETSPAPPKSCPEVRWRMSLWLYRSRAWCPGAAVHAARWGRRLSWRESRGGNRSWAGRTRSVPPPTRERERERAHYSLQPPADNGHNLLWLAGVNTGAEYPTTSNNFQEVIESRWISWWILGLQFPTAGGGPIASWILGLHIPRNI